MSRFNKVNSTFSNHFFVVQDFTYQGTVDDFETDYYSGMAHNYTLDCSGTGGCGPGNFYIWYMVDENYRPIEQGEGCQVMPRTSQC